MNAHPRAEHLMTVEDFLAFADARPDDELWELIDGAPVRMEHPTVDHAIIVGNLIDAISRKIRPRGCRLHHRVLVRRADRNDFGGSPDLALRCGAIDGRRRTIADAFAIVEVVSPSSMTNDRGEKLRHYLSMQTLRHVALVYEREVRVELWTRGVEGSWPAEPQVLHNPGDALRLRSFDVSVALSAIYADTSVATA